MAELFGLFERVAADPYLHALARDINTVHTDSVAQSCLSRLRNTVNRLHQLAVFGEARREEPRSEPSEAIEEAEKCVLYLSGLIEQMTRERADVQKRLDEMTALKDSYLKTIDEAMACVEAVIATTCGTMVKSDIDGRGAEFFKHAKDIIPRRIEAHVKYVKDMSTVKVKEQQETIAQLTAEVRELRLKNAELQKNTKPSELDLLCEKLKANGITVDPARVNKLLSKLA